MKSTIVFSSTNDNSLAKEIVEKLNKENKYQIIDLYKDNFNPVMTLKEEKLYQSGETDCDLVKKYQQMIKESEELVLVFPLWINNIPAILKGFFDKVLIKEFGFTEENNKPKGLLTNVTKGLVVSTSESSIKDLEKLGNPIETVVVKGALEMCGMTNIEYINVNAENKDENLKKYFG